MRRAAPYGKADATGPTDSGELALYAIKLVLGEIERRADADQVAAQRLRSDLLRLLLSPPGRAVQPYATDVIARLLGRGAVAAPPAQPAVPGDATARESVL